MTENEIGTIIVNAAITVHRVLGPGLLESVYEITLTHELKKTWPLGHPASSYQYRI